MGLARLTFALFIAQPIEGHIKGRKPIHPDLMAMLHRTLFAMEYPHLSAALAQAGGES